MGFYLKINRNTYRNLSLLKKIEVKRWLAQVTDIVGKAMHAAGFTRVIP